MEIHWIISVIAPFWLVNIIANLIKFPGCFFGKRYERENFMVKVFNILNRSSLTLEVILWKLIDDELCHLLLETTNYYSSICSFAPTSSQLKNPSFIYSGAKYFHIKLPSFSLTIQLYLHKIFQFSFIFVFEANRYCFIKYTNYITFIFTYLWKNKIEKGGMPISQAEETC